MYGYFCRHNRSTMYIVYGIPNCDTVKKVLTWLQKHKLPYEFHDYKTAGITPAKLKSWSKQVGWETLLNKRGTTWKALDARAQAVITTEKTAIAFMAENTSSIKRPVIEAEGRVITVGFDEKLYAGIFKK
ncbi:MAG: ArsC family reductase [Sediminibacterium sp.]|nr:ArsC family reductase [Sediminibacterium sp.]